MSLTLRRLKGRALTQEEMDRNLEALGSFQAAPAGAQARPMRDKAAERLSVADFRTAVALDDTAAFKACAALGRPAFVPWRETQYVLSETINALPGTAFYGDPGAKPTIRWNSAATARMFDFNACERGGLWNLRLDGNKALAPTGPSIRVRDCRKVKLEDLECLDLCGDSTGCIVFSGTTSWCAARRIELDDPEGTGIGLTGAGVQWNRVAEIDVLRSGHFGVRLGEGASFNRVSDVNGLDTGIEVVGLAHGTRFNIVDGALAVGAGDNGVSVTGDYNVVANSINYKNDKAGIGIWGSFNALTGNVNVSNDQLNTGTWAGIWIGNGFGGAGQNNIGVGNICDDDQAAMTQNWTVRIPPNAYTAWATGQTVAAGEYRFHGLNIYRAAAAGTTGATAPAHTAGAVSDGGVSWTWMGSARGQMTPRINFIGLTGAGGRSKSGQGANDSSGWVNNELFGYGANKRHGNYPAAATGLLQYETYIEAGVFKRAP